MAAPVHYSDYLQLDRILDAQQPESDKAGRPAHDEMLFIIIHQAYELWFKQLLHEVESVSAILSRPTLNDNSPDLQVIVHRLSRCVTILKLLVQQIDVMETMTPMDFLEFRDLLRPASGFQSWQFKVLEARLGLTYADRFGQEYYISQLRPEQVELIRKAEASPSILNLLNSWLERMPFFADASLWEQFSMHPDTPATTLFGAEPGAARFWNEYYRIYTKGLAEAENRNREFFEQQFAESTTQRSGLSARASRAALFIMLYRGYPMLQLPFQVLNVLLEIDEQLSTWRYRHMSMVHRTIGSRIGTGGSTGREYLKGALDKHIIFGDIARLTSFLVERSSLPGLSGEMEGKLGYGGGSR